MVRLLGGRSIVLDRIFEPELRAIHAAAEQERRKLVQIDLRILRLEFELAVERSLNQAYCRIIEMQSAITNGLREGHDMRSYVYEMREAAFSVAETARDGMAVPLREFDKTREQRIQAFECWLEKHYGL